jgi:hypothetical protein
MSIFFHTNTRHLFTIILDAFFYIPPYPSFRAQMKSNFITNERTTQNVSSIRVNRLETGDNNTIPLRINLFVFLIYTHTIKDLGLTS